MKHLSKLLSIALIISFFTCIPLQAAYLDKNYMQELEQLEELWKKEQPTEENNKITSGKEILVELTDNLDSENKNAYEIQSRLLAPIKKNGKTLVPEGAILTGEIEPEKATSKFQHKTNLSVVFTQIEYDDSLINIDAKIKTKDNTGVLKCDSPFDNPKKALLSLGITATGTAIILGAIAIVLPNTLLGLITGIGAGILIGKNWLNTQCKIFIPAGTKLILKIENDLFLDEI